MSNCPVQQKGRTGDSKHNAVETFYNNVRIFASRIIYPQKPQNISVRFRDLDHQEGLFDVGGGGGGGGGGGT